MILAGGRHILCSPQILRKDMVSCTPMEIKTEEERFKAICVNLRTDEIRYCDILEEIKKGVYIGRDKHPTTVPNAYELLLQTSQQIGYNQRCTGKSGHRALTSGKSEGSMFAHQGGRDGRGERSGC